jgi:hypothetical protein
MTTKISNVALLPHHFESSSQGIHDPHMVFVYSIYLLSKTISPTSAMPLIDLSSMFLLFFPQHFFLLLPPSLRLSMPILIVLSEADDPPVGLSGIDEVIFAAIATLVFI